MEFKNKAPGKVKTFLHVRCTDVNIFVEEIKIRICFAHNLPVSLHYLLDVKVYKMIEGVDVLFDHALYLTRSLIVNLWLKPACQAVIHRVYVTNQINNE